MRPAGPRFPEQELYFTWKKQKPESTASSPE